MAAQEVIELGVASRTMPGQSITGDAHLVRALEDGVLLSVIDGLGHGPEAASAARLAVEALESLPVESVESLLEQCHGRLKGSRGAVMSLARLSIPHGTLTWAGVGNVEGRLLKASGGRKPSSSYLDPQQGIVGHQIPTLRSRTLPLDRGDVILFATDGVKGGFASAQGPSIFREPAGRIAERILEEFAAGRDDALLLVARYLGRGGTP